MIDILGVADLQRPGDGKGREENGKCWSEIRDFVAT
jgi:hypothetical protein